MATLDHRPRTVGSVRDEHLSLMKAWRGLPDDDARCEAAAAFRHSVRDAGRDIASAVERDEAQGIIDYWASAIAGLPGKSYPEILTLAPYSGAAADRAGQSAAEVFASLGSEEEKRAARQLFQNLLDPGPHGIERARPQTRDMLRRRIRSPVLDDVIALFAGTGAITVLHGETPEDDRCEVSDTRVIDRWPQLHDWLDQQRLYHEERAAVLAEAERWQAAGEDRDLLVTGRRVDTLERFRGQTDTVDRFIDASRRRKRRRANLRLGALGLLAVGGVTVASVMISLNSAREYWREEVVESDQATVREQLAPVVANVTRTVSSGTSANLTPKAATVRSASGLPGISGALWLGSATRSQVRPVAGEPRVLPADALAGTRYRVPAGIVLRDGMPDPEGPYLSKARKALVPAGSLVVVEGRPQAYDRPSGTQYWANVRVVPRVYIQYAGGDAARRETLRRIVSQAGFDVPPAERTASAARQREVRWSNAQDRAAASQLVAALDGAGVPDLACRSLERAARRNAPFILELWLDFTAPAPASPPPAC